MEEIMIGVQGEEFSRTDLLVLVLEAKEQGLSAYQAIIWIRDRLPQSCPYQIKEAYYAS